MIAKVGRGDTLAISTVRHSNKVSKNGYSSNPAPGEKFRYQRQRTANSLRIPYFQSRTGCYQLVVFDVTLDPALFTERCCPDGVRFL
jgi:hypothetical protein